MTVESLCRYSLSVVFTIADRVFYGSVMQYTMTCIVSFQSLTAVSKYLMYAYSKYLVYAYSVVQNSSRS